MKKKLRLLWENFQVQTLWEKFLDQRQFEETYTKTTLRKNCNFCGKIFRTKGNLKKHIQKNMKKKVQLLWENFSDRRQFEKSQTKKT